MHVPGMISSRVVVEKISFRKLIQILKKGPVALINHSFSILPKKGFLFPSLFVFRLLIFNDSSIGLLRNPWQSISLEWKAAIVVVHSRQNHSKIVSCIRNWREDFFGDFCLVCDAKAPSLSVGNWVMVGPKKKCPTLVLLNFWSCWDLSRDDVPSVKSSSSFLSFFVSSLHSRLDFTCGRNDEMHHASNFCKMMIRGSLLF